MATLNRWVAAGLLLLAVLLIGFGVIMGAFGWLNDGPRAGLGILVIAGAFAAGCAAAAAAFRVAAAAHASCHPRRWLTQIVVVIAAYVAFGMAAWTTSLID